MEEDLDVLLMRLDSLDAKAKNELVDHLEHVYNLR
jgi:hypothetical protein